MQLSLVSFGADAARGLSAIGRANGAAPGREETGTPESIDLDISGDAKRGGRRAFFTAQPIFW